MKFKRITLNGIIGNIDSGSDWEKEIKGFKVWIDYRLPAGIHGFF